MSVCTYYVIKGKKLNKEGKEVANGYLSEAWNTGGMMCLNPSLENAYSFGTPETAKERLAVAHREFNLGYNPDGNVTELTVLKVTITTEFEEI